MTRSRRLVAALAVAVLVAAGAVVAWAARDGGPVPPARPLDEALTRALGARLGGGVSARFTVSNDLLPAGAVGPPLSALLGAGAGGQLHLAADGRFRIDLDTAAGPLQVAYDGRRLSVFSPLLPAVYEAALPRGALRAAGDRPSLAQVRMALAGLARVATVSRARPVNVADRPAYEVRVDPRDDGGLLGAVELAWDAARGLPLRAAVYAQGADEPAFEVAVTDVAFGRVRDADLALDAPPGLPRITLDDDAPAARPPRASRAGAAPPAPPRRLAGLERTVLERGLGGAAGTLAVYGAGLGTVVVVQVPAGAGDFAGRGLGLPEVNVEGATGVELATALGTAISVSHDGLSSVVFGLVPPLAVENAARGLVRSG